LIRDEGSVLERLTRELGLTRGEAEAYLRALKEGSLHMDDEVSRQLLARGMLIQASDEKVYLPVHPRLAISNLFRSFPDRTSVQMREKRKMCDKLTLELIPAYEARRRSA
jgi:formate dehydrogenase maturation protein FdhE